MRTSDIADLIVEAADKLIVPRFRSLEQGEVMEKQPGDLVTVADQEAEVYITERILAAFPESVVLGEEATVKAPDLFDRFYVAPHRWTLDPVDGTKNFVNGNPDFAVMLTEAVGGVIERTWIWQPIHELMYVAERGRGLTCNGQAVPSADAPLKPYRGVADGWAEGLTLPGVDGAIALRPACAGVQYPQLAEGRYDFIVDTMGFEWDHLPGLGVLHEVGGVIRTDKGEPYGPGTRCDYLIAARSEQVWAEVRDQLAALRVAAGASPTTRLADRSGP